MRPLDFLVESSDLFLVAREARWDTAIFGFPVISIEKLKIIDPDGARKDYIYYEEWINSEQVGIVSCRLSNNDLRESMFLEAHGFRFIEMVLHPRLDLFQYSVISEDKLHIALADAADLDELEHIAQVSFEFERYHIDPRLSSEYANRRYSKWVNNSYYDGVQDLYKVMHGEEIVAFFITENRDANHVYWHLTALAPRRRRQGYGYRVWMAMLNYHKLHGCRFVNTTISVRNLPVLNLYSKLNFRFESPEMTFHWLRDH